MSLSVEGVQCSGGNRHLSESHRRDHLWDAELRQCVAAPTPSFAAYEHLLRCQPWVGARGPRKTWPLPAMGVRGGEKQVQEMT